MTGSQRRVGRLAGAAVFLMMACRPSAPPPAAWEEGDGYRFRALAPAGTGRDGFTAMDPGMTGITFRNSVSDSALLRNQLLADGGGVAIADVDGDGLADVYLCHTEGPNALYRNLGGLRFQNIAVEAGVAAADRASTGATFADVDGDRDQDLLLNALGGPNTLYLNDGAGHFTEDTTYPGRRSRAGSTTSTLADVDGDGDLDLYTANYKAYTAVDRYSPQERAFDQVVRRKGPREFEVVERMRPDYRVILVEYPQGVALVQRAEPDFFYLNRGDGRFEEAPIASSSRWLDEAGRPFAEPPDNFTLATRFYDVNGDLAPDLYVANDFEDPDQFWINDGRGNFRLLPRLAQRTTSNAAMAVDFADVNRDGHVDLFEVDMLSRDSRRLRTQIPTHTPLPKRAGELDDRPQFQRNTLFLNRGDGTFAQIAEMAGVDASGWTWGTIFLDVDLDGWEDLLVATGNYWDFMDADTQERLRNRLSDLDWRQQRMTYPRLEVPNYAFRNRGDLSFEDVSDKWRFSQGVDISHGMATGDLDGDGDLDVVVNRLDSPALVLRNDAPARRVAIRLLGLSHNTTGIGAKVRVRNGAVPFQEREMTSGGLYLSSGDPMLTFGTGTADSVVVEVAWRDGTRSTVPTARPGHLYEIDQRGATPAPSGQPPAREEPLFTDQTDQLAHLHVEGPFEDAARQPLLPNGFARLGPGVSWYDLDGDGDEDLLIGAGRTGRLALYRNDGGRLTEVPTGLEASGDLTSILAVPGPDGMTTLLVGQSSYEEPDASAALALPSVLSLDLDARGRPVSPSRTAVPGDTGSVGPLAVADYDRDGDLDLFVGSRIIPGAYPLSPSSRLLLNDGTGRFTLDPWNSTLLRHLGMISSAVFSDLDGDGDPDLALAVEWGPVKLFLNDGGRFKQAPPSWGFDRFFSRWLGLASGDFDGDGRLDLVATSWGRNVRPGADSTRPLLLYFGSFDDNGTLDLLLARHDPRIGAVTPLTSYGRLRVALPEVARRTRTFAAYAEATVDQVLGPAAPAALRLGVTGFDHLLFLNRGDRFEARPLPVEAQFAPAFGPVVADFDGNGTEDLALSQNFFDTDLDTPRYDAGRSLLLLGDGHGGFSAASGDRSGLKVYGDQRGAAAADYDGDGRTDLVITQNGAPTRLFRNHGAHPGLRVRLAGASGNPQGIGAVIRLRTGSGAGPAREIQGGSGYWSLNGALQVLAAPVAQATLVVRWPDGRTSETAIAPGNRTVTVRP